jgi:hypothetical protein
MALLEVLTRRHTVYLFSTVPRTHYRRAAQFTVSDPAPALANAKNWPGLAPPQRRKTVGPD